MNTFIDLIALLKHNAPTYIGRNSILALEAFIQGWQIGHASNEFTDFGQVRDFQDWVSNKYNIKSTQSWSRIILFFSQDEYDALNNFFQLYNTWLVEKNYGLTNKIQQLPRDVDDDNPKTFVALITLLKNRTAMYIGRNSILALEGFLLGWKFAQQTINIENFSIEENSFQKWISHQYKITTNQSWIDIILFFSQDEEMALKQFFELFDKWLIQYLND